MKEDFCGTVKRHAAWLHPSIVDAPNAIYCWRLASSVIGRAGPSPEGRVLRSPAESHEQQCCVDPTDPRPTALQPLLYFAWSPWNETKQTACHWLRCSKTKTCKSVPYLKIEKITQRKRPATEKTS